MLNFVVVVAAITPRQHADAEPASAFSCTSWRACLTILAVFNKHLCPLVSVLYKKAWRLHWHKLCCARCRSRVEVKSEPPDMNVASAMPPWCPPLKALVNWATLEGPVQKRSLIIGFRRRKSRTNTTPSPSHQHWLASYSD